MNQPGWAVNAAVSAGVDPGSVVSQRSVTAWMTGAHCATRPDLPWLADWAPVFVIERMAALCEGCPVTAACDAFVVTMSGTEMAVTGGFWARKYRNPAPTVIFDAAAVQLALPGLSVTLYAPGVAA